MNTSRAWSLGANCENDDTGVIAKIIDQCNDYGMDAIEIGNVLSMYMEATDRACVPGPGLAWGDGMSMVATVELLARRQGIGNVLADGTARAAAAFGHPEIGMTVKDRRSPPTTLVDSKAKGWPMPPATAGPATCGGTRRPPRSSAFRTRPIRWSGKARANY